jgi:hypothetical protein
VGANDVPRRIYILWLQGFADAPEVVRACARSWRERNPRWTVVELDETNVAEHLSTPLPIDRTTMTTQAYADVVRTALLAEHGGVWADATCFCVRPLDDWLPMATARFFAFSRPGRERLLSTWFLASAADSRLMRAWAGRIREYLDGARFSRQETKVGTALRVALRLTLNRDPMLATLWLRKPVRDLLRVHPYFWVHFTFADVLRRDPALRAEWFSTPQISAAGPHLLRFNGITNPPSAEVAADMAEGVTPVYKLSWRYDEATTDDTSALRLLLATLDS